MSSTGPLKAEAGQPTGYQACTVSQCGQCTEVDTEAWNKKPQPHE